MTLQAKADALKALTNWRMSGSVRTHQVEKLEDEIFLLAEQIRAYKVEETTAIPKEGEKS